MGARQKLNRVSLMGDAVLAGIAGALMNSWLAFFAVLALLIGLDVHAGDIRPKKRNCDGKRGGRL